VREALQKEGNNCLPLIVVNNSIVSRSVYPSRNELMAFAGITPERKAGHAEDSTAPASPLYLESDTAGCGPGCDCGTPAKGRTMKVVGSLIVLLAVGGIFIYKASTTQQNPPNDAAAKSGSAFNLGPAASNAQPGSDSQSSEVAKSIIGEYLESLGALNQVALDEDVVFVYIPAKSDEPVSSKTNDAILAAQQTLGRNNIRLGLYTLPTSSPDYSSLSAQVQSPAILIAIKGKGMSAVSGDVTETKLLQAYTAAASAGGCGPSGCGPSGASCP